MKYFLIFLLLLARCFAGDQLIGNVTVQQKVIFQGDVAATITSDQNDYNPTNLSTAVALALSGNTAVNLTGIQGGVDGRLLWVYNYNTSGVITLVSGSASSTAANRFSFPADYIIPANGGSVLLMYDSTASRWRLAGSSVSTGTYEPVITAGTSAQYWRGDKSFAVLNQAAVAGLTTADSPTFAGLNLTGNMTVPDAWKLTSSGTLQIVGVTGGAVVVNIGGVATANIPAPTFPGLQVIADTGVRTSIVLDTVGSTPTYIGRYANGTRTVPTAVLNNQVIGQYSGVGYGATNYTAGRPGFQVTSSGDWNDYYFPTRLVYSVSSSLTSGGLTPNSTNGSSATINSLVLLDNGAQQWGAAKTITAWGSNGADWRVLNHVVTDATSSGTVSTITAFTSLGPNLTVNSLVAANYDILAGLYLGADPGVTGNATLTASTGVSYAFYNAGKTRAVGRIDLGSATPGNISGSSGSITLAAAGTDQNVNITHSGDGFITLTAPSGHGTQVRVLAPTGFDPFLYIDGDAGRNRRLMFRTGTSTRWGIFANNNAESTGDAGSAFTVNAYNDSGAFVDSPITITRVAGGSVTLARPLAMLSNSIFLGSATPGSISGSSGSITIAAAGTNQAISLLPSGTGNITLTGPVNINSNIRTSGVQNYFTVTTPADTGITASTESIGVNFSAATRTWATTGTVGLQREVIFSSKTYASASASQTFTDVTTVAIQPPIQGTNAIFTRGHSLIIQDSTSASSAITGGLIIATSVGTASTSIGFGGGNGNFGGTVTTGGAVSVGTNLTLAGTAIFTKPGGTIPIFTTNTAITTGAGASAGTLTNAPAVGNPTKWVPFNDNGTTRYFPAW